ncbi:hypothetical protein OCOJLMKI_4875 [Methylobacterium iners]|uniref:Uncharacterized protein n=1 Tax=Methylobacterium iners TaxID=418707 RepID=A0ABQ4S5G8_9HYPH|nr:hypothetical protein OCOJLMKI_4875 [Methylobacterium iners]
METESAPRLGSMTAMPKLVRAKRESNLLAVLKL